MYWWVTSYTCAEAAAAYCCCWGYAANCVLVGAASSTTALGSCRAAKYQHHTWALQLIHTARANTRIAHTCSSRTAALGSCRAAAHQHCTSATLQLIHTARANTRAPAAAAPPRWGPAAPPPPPLPPSLPARGHPLGRSGGPICAAPVGKEERLCHDVCIFNSNRGCTSVEFAVAAIIARTGPFLGSVRWPDMCST